MKLIPTMWRTCRVLANGQRLRCLQAVLKRPGRFVSEVAHELRVPVPVASQYLRDLQARGLISVERRSRWTFYGDRPDAAVGHAAPIVAAMKQALMKDALTPERVKNVLQGFTHPRRLMILGVLSPVKVLRVTDMRRATGISEPALLRHLRRLEVSGLVSCNDERWLLRLHQPAFAKQLLQEAGVGKG
jgi:DNA-binding transcriptional ArsR family regulator